MAKGKHRRAKPKKNEHLGLVWSIFATAAAVSALGLFICSAFPDWRIVGETFIYWIDTHDNLKTEKYEPTKYGLYVISFNGGVTSEAWYVKVSRICGGIDIYAPYGSLGDMFTASPCPETCISHYRSRCSVYRRLQMTGYVTLGSSIIVGLLAVLGVCWLIVISKSPILLQLLWLGGGVANLSIISWWLYETDKGFKQLGIQSQFPYASIGPACYGSLVFSAALATLGILISAAAWLEDIAKWRKREGDINQAIIGEQPPSFGTPFSPFSASSPASTRYSSPRPPSPPNPHKSIGQQIGGVGPAMGGLGRPGFGPGQPMLLGKAPSPPRQQIQLTGTPPKYPTPPSGMLPVTPDRRR